MTGIVSTGVGRVRACCLRHLLQNSCVYAPYCTKLPSPQGDSAGELRTSFSQEQYTKPACICHAQWERAFENSHFLMCTVLPAAQWAESRPLMLQLQMGSPEKRVRNKSITDWDHTSVGHGRNYHVVIVHATLKVPLSRRRFCQFSSSEEHPPPGCDQLPNRKHCGMPWD